MTRAVPPTRVPRDIRHAVMLRRRQQLNVLTPLGRVLTLLLLLLIRREVEVPELNVAFLGGFKGGEDDLTTAWGPEDSVA